MPAKSKDILQSIFSKEKPWKEMAKDASFSRPVIPTYPGGVFDRPMGRSARIFSPTMKACVWGQPRNVTLSLLKTDVFDRRIYRAKPFTADEVIEGAFSEANKDYDDMPWIGLTRPKYGVLLKTGGREDQRAASELYPFPCQKPVGQVIVRAEDLAGAAQPDAVQRMDSGLTSVHMESTTGAALDLEYLLSMKRRNIIAVRADYRNLHRGLSFRLYRHTDQGHRRYMDENGNYLPLEQRKVVFHPADPNEPVRYYDYEADAAINGPFEPPASGADGRFFWVRQRFPAEATFPEGFEYVMMGLVSDAGAGVSAQGLQKGLGTAQGLPRDADGRIKLPFATIGHDEEFVKQDQAYALVRNAPGVAGTAELPDAGTGSAVLYVAVVTLCEAKDIMAEARRQLLEAERLGYAALAKENREWYEEFYDRRESGRIAVAAEGGERERIDRAMLDDTFVSWSGHHGGYCFPDPSRLEGSAGYAAFDIDTQSWHSLPCYNEIFGEPEIVHNRYELLFMWLKLVETWRDALVRKAHDIYGCPGMTIAHGYLPPAKPDPWYIENQTLDFCAEVPGQMVKALWSLWDYRGDEELLRGHVYPIVRDLAVFYEAFARKHYDGRYFNLLPVAETESWGISYQLRHTQNTTGAIAVFRKILNCAIEGAELLGVDEGLIPGWREVAEHLPPYPKFLVGCGEILAGNPGAMPRWSAGDHEFFTGVYPASIADEINLDSPEEDKELIARTLDTVRANMNAFVYPLVGKFKDHDPCGYNLPAVKIDNGYQLMHKANEEPERLLNSRGGRIHVFPVVPGWSEIAFNEFLARGGFAVSAAKDAGGVKAVVIRATRSVPCRLMNPWAGSAVIVTDLSCGAAVAHEIDASNGECIVFEARKGHEYSIDRA